jgi:hypothetical protein
MMTGKETHTKDLIVRDDANAGGAARNFFLVFGVYQFVSDARPSYQCPA